MYYVRYFLLLFSFVKCSLSIYFIMEILLMKLKLLSLISGVFFGVLCDRVCESKQTKCKQENGT